MFKNYFKYNTVYMHGLRNIFYLNMSYIKYLPLPFCFFFFELVFLFCPSLKPSVTPKNIWDKDLTLSFPLHSPFS